jgi:hypothetical protein
MEGRMATGLEIEATIRDVERDDNGWYTVVTDEGRFSTKIAEKAEEARRLNGSRVLIRYDEQVKNKDGRQYRNRYYDRASQVASHDTPRNGGGATSDGFTQTSSRRTPPEDAWRMCLNKGGELAVATLPLMANEHRTFPNQKEIALAWARWFLFTPIPLKHPPPPTLPSIPQPQQS